VLELDKMTSRGPFQPQPFCGSASIKLSWIRTYF